MKKVTNIMVDCETLGVVPGCSILSIGACSFDLTRTFYRSITHESCRAYGFHEELPTVRWWCKQKDSVIVEAFAGGSSIEAALEDFAQFLKQFESFRIWSKGADFDLPILSRAFYLIGDPTPWEKNTGCFRTLQETFPDIPLPDRRELEAHNALNDALYQAAHAQWIIRSRRLPF